MCHTCPSCQQATTRIARAKVFANALNRGDRIPKVINEEVLVYYPCRHVLMRSGDPLKFERLCEDLLGCGFRNLEQHTDYHANN